MAAKVVYIPLDERPCNYNFPSEIFKDNINLIVPDINIMGQKKQPAEHLKLKDFLVKETKDAFGLVLSIDTLLYGGIVPSRLHYMKLDEIKERLSILKEIKNNNPSLKIYAFQLIMRCPQYNSSDEEPPYYKDHGRNIYLSGYYQNKQELGIITNEELEYARKVKVDDEFLNDFLNRRNINRLMNIETLDFLEAGIIDFLIIPQDDASEYSFTASDQEKIRKVIKDKKLFLKAYMYPGADEVGCTLVARMYNHYLGKKPTVFIKYPSASTATVIPCLEDRYLDTTIKYQIIAAGGIVVPSLVDADIVLIALSGATKMVSGPNNISTRDVDVLCNLPEIFEFAINAVNNNYPVMIADLIYLNGGSYDVLSYIDLSNLTLHLASYSGWNTSSNSLGTTIAQGLNYLYNGKTKSHLEFLIKRYVEDIGYCSYTREKVTNLLPKYNMDYFNVEEKDGIASNLVSNHLDQFRNKYLHNIKDLFVISDVNLPWKRMFEVDFKIKYIGKIND